MWEPPRRIQVRELPPRQQQKSEPKEAACPPIKQPVQQLTHEPVQQSIQQPVQQPVQQAHLKIKTKFGLVKFVLLSIVTLGMYIIYCTAKMGNILNRIASPYDGKTTMNFWLLALIVGPITLGIGYAVWHHKFCARLGRELKRRDVDCSISAGTFWLWTILGIVMLIGPFIYMYKVMNAMNKLIDKYNEQDT